MTKKLDSHLVLLDEPLFDRLHEQARRNPRLRQNFNLHQDYADPCQRLLNALEPGTYVRPHRHVTPAKPECFILLRGRLAALLFADSGELQQVVELSPQGPVFGLEIPAGHWHGCLALEPGSLFFECKPGPYEPLDDKDFAPWAPTEGEAGVEEYLCQLERQVRSWNAD